MINCYCASSQIALPLPHVAHCRMRLWVVLVFVVSLLLSCESQGPSAGTPVFVQKGGDVLLNVDADVPEDFILVEWNFNKTDILVRFPSGREPLVSPGYAGRIEFPEKKYSVKLKNLTEADSGVYTAKVSSTGDQTLAEYNVIVQDSKQGDSNVTGAVVPVFVILGIIAGIIAGLYLYRRKIRNYNRESIENTVYEIPQVGTTAQPLDQSPTDDASGLSPTSTYCLVGTHSGPPETNKTRDTTVPERLYAPVEKPARFLKN
ncbi:uncharacterized protein LOC141777657 [Sebastes fasciatus]|uniref:uncharacterized protein LOC141777657 n=1 Tax=Sebastes fasciatus TaxID=394691 RepID=UPI003D9EE0B6